MTRVIWSLSLAQHNIWLARLDYCRIEFKYFNKSSSNSSRTVWLVYILVFFLSGCPRFLIFIQVSYLLWYLSMWCVKMYHEYESDVVHIWRTLNSHQQNKTINYLQNCFMVVLEIACLPCPFSCWRCFQRFTPWFSQDQATQRC